MFQQLILASASPRRREILAQAGIPFTVQVANFDEEKIRKELAQNNKKIENIDFSEHYVKALALGKASAVLAENVDIFRIVVLGADTVVVHRGEILNKPVDLADARGMLLRLQGDVHTVYTGVALCYRREDSDNSLIFSNFAVRTEVVFYPMNQEEIEEYLNCGEYMDKAGAYAIQGKMAAYIKEIHGDYYNVVGLPLSAIVQELKRLRENV
jgi:septum formation protein